MGAETFKIKSGGSFLTLFDQENGTAKQHLSCTIVATFLPPSPLVIQLYSPGISIHAVLVS